MGAGRSRGDVAERIWHELRRIADALESFRPEPESPDPETLCLHPTRERLQAGPGWICGVCQQPCPLPDPAIPA